MGARAHFVIVMAQEILHSRKEGPPLLLLHGGHKEEEE